MMDTIRPLPVISTVQVVNKRTAPGYLLHASQKCSNSTVFSSSDALFVFDVRKGAK